jgi:hypothetical protein
MRLVSMGALPAVFALRRRIVALSRVLLTHWVQPLG